LVQNLRVFAGSPDHRIDVYTIFIHRKITEKLLDCFTAQRPRRKENQRGCNKSTVQQKNPYSN